MYVESFGISFKRFYQLLVVSMIPLNHFVDLISNVLLFCVVSSTTVSCILPPRHVFYSVLAFSFWRHPWRLSNLTENFLFWNVLHS